MESIHCDINVGCISPERPLSDLRIGCASHTRGDMMAYPDCGTFEHNVYTPNATDEDMTSSVTSLLACKRFSKKKKPREAVTTVLRFLKIRSARGGFFFEFYK